ncbi:MAG: hypothetical protein MJE77_00235 [Proteobacteria bacterium]|nr:hypothetical protein [Pseudomonadota bacterium]
MAPSSDKFKPLPLAAPSSTRSVFAFAHLPEAFRLLLPEIDAAPAGPVTWREESRADCRRCVMSPAVSGDSLDTPWAFHPDARCCTFHPALANFLAGQALRRGGRSARAIAGRVAEATGVSAWGIRPSAAWLEHYNNNADDRFGRDLALRCPYWVGGDHACGIWSDRPSTCRTWYCKHDRGLAGAAVWAQLQRALAHVENLLADLCSARGQPPVHPARPDEWLVWYRWCAEYIETADRDDLIAVADPALAEARADLLTIARRPESEIADVVVPSVESTWVEQGGIRISGYSRYDTIIAPRSIFVFLSGLDGTSTWRQAQAEMAKQGHEPVTDEIVSELYRIGAIEAPGSPSPTVIRRTPWPG